MTTTLERPAAAGPAVPARDRPHRWERPALLALLAVTAVLYLWGLGRSGWANSFYSAAAQAGSQSWKAFFYGSSDAANSITVDKTPASLWVMALSVRIFGLSSWSILVPQALMGVGSVGLLYATVKRWSGPAAGLIAGAVLALTPVAVLMFRFNNPDALLVLLLVAAAYATVRATEKASARWLVLAGALVGVRLPHQDAAGAAGRAGARRGVPGRRADHGPPAGRPPARRRAGAAGLGRLVGRDRGAGARVGPAVHRRLAAQLDPRADPRLQRPRPAHRQRDRQRRRRWWRRDRHVGADRLEPAVRQRDRRPGRLAAAGGADPAGRRAGGDRAAAPDRPHPGGAAAVGRLAARHRADVQLHGRDLPRLLHGRAGAGDRRAGRHRRGAAVAAAGRRRRCWRSRSR